MWKTGTSTSATTRGRGDVGQKFTCLLGPSDIDIYIDTGTDRYVGREVYLEIGADIDVD